MSINTIEKIIEIPEGSGKKYVASYEVTTNEDGTETEIQLGNPSEYIEPEPIIVPEPITQIALDSTETAKFFLKHSLEIELWVASSKKPTILKSILARQGSVLDLELIELLTEFIKSDVEDPEVSIKADGKLCTEILALLEQLKGKIEV